MHSNCCFSSLLKLLKVPEPNETFKIAYSDELHCSNNDIAMTIVDLSKCLFPGRKSKHIILHCTGFTGFHVCGIPMTLLRTVARIQFVGSGRFGEVSWLLIVSALIEAFVLMGALEWAVDSHRP